MGPGKRTSGGAGAQRSTEHPEGGETGAERLVRREGAKARKPGAPGPLLAGILAGRKRAARRTGAAPAMRDA